MSELRATGDVVTGVRKRPPTLRELRRTRDVRPAPVATCVRVPGAGGTRVEIRVHRKDAEPRGVDYPKRVIASFGPFDGRTFSPRSVFGVTIAKLLGAGVAEIRNLPGRVSPLRRVPWVKP